MLEPSAADEDGVRRRATWREAGGAGAVGDDATRHDDDALADALAAEVAAVTSSIPVIRRDAGTEVASADELFAALMEDSASAAVARDRYPEPEPEPEPEQLQIDPAPQVEVLPEPEPVYEHVHDLDLEGSLHLERGLDPEAVRDPETSAPMEYLPSEPPRYEAGAESWRDLALLPAVDSGPPAGELPTDAPAAAELEFAESLAAAEQLGPVELPELVEPPRDASPQVAPATLASSSFGSLLHAAPPPIPGSMALPAADAPLPEPPALRSLDDDTLAEVLNRTTATAGVAGALAELELQMQLREEDAQEFDSWERALRAIGTPEALVRIEAVRSRMQERFTIPVIDDDGGTVADTGTGFAAQLPDTTQAADVAPGIDTVPQDFAAPDETAVDDDSNEIDETDWAAFLGAADHDPPAARVEPELFAVPAAQAPTVPPPAAVPRDDTPVLAEEAVARQRVFALEVNDGEPTLLEYRAGRASRMFWQWFALNSSVVSIAVGAALFGLGMSVRQALVAVLVGVGLSLLPLGLGTLAGKWSGQPTMIVSRAAFGVLGNVVPSLLAVLSRVFWSSALLWIIAAGVISSVETFTAATAPTWLGPAVIGSALALAATVATYGFALLLRVAAALGVLSGLLVIGVVALTAPQLDMSSALATRDGDWLLTVTGAVLVFSVIGLAWANAGAELARYQRAGGSGAGSIIWTMLGSALPALGLLGYGVLLAASDASLASELAADPIAAMAGLLPAWYALPLLGALVLSLVAGVVLSVYSGGFSLQAAGVRVPRVAGTLAVAFAAGILGVLLVFSTADLGTLLRDAATTLAVPVAAWAGIFACDLMIRTERFAAAALMRRGSTYGDVNWVNCSMLVLASIVGFGLTSASLAGLDWQGYLWPVLGVEVGSTLAASDIGVLAALLLGLLTPLVSGVGRIRRQEESSSR